MPGKYGLPTREGTRRFWAKRSAIVYDPLLVGANYVLSWPVEAWINAHVHWNPDFGATGTLEEKLSGFHPVDPVLGLSMGAAAILGYHRKNIFGTVVPLVAALWNESQHFGHDPAYTPGQFLFCILLRTGIMAGSYYTGYFAREGRERLRAQLHMEPAHPLHP